MNATIAAEVALSFVLLFGAGLFLTTNSRLRQVSLGFDPRNVLSLRVIAGGDHASSGDRERAFAREALRQAERAGLRQTAIASAPPLSGGEWISYTVPGLKRPRSGEEPDSLVRVVSPGFFPLLRIPLLAGRAFTEMDSESSSRVAIVNENFARAAFAGENPIGKLLEIQEGNRSIPAGPVEIVGLAANTRGLGVAEVPFQDIYLPFAQNPQRTISLMGKLSGPAGGTEARLRTDLQRLDADSALFDSQTLDEMVARQFQGERFRMMLVSLFAVLAALLAGVGIYGTIAFSVAQRTREFALRIALGALPGAIRRITLERTALLTLAGAAIGLAIALVLGEFLKSALYLVPHQHTGLLFGVGIHDPASLLAAGGILLSLALFASLIPATRAAAVEPAAELRHD